MTRRAGALLVALLVVGTPGPHVQAAPKVVSVYPLGGQRGTALEVEVRGTGLEGTYAFWLGPDAVIQEATAPHHTAETAQSLKLPVAVNGRISATGQLAYYAFDIPH